MAHEENQQLTESHETGQMTGQAVESGHASETGQLSHEPTIFAEPIYEIGSFKITNSLINSTIAVVIIVAFLIAAGRKIKKIPSGVQNFFEMLFEGALNFADSVTGERSKSEKFLPIVLTLFLFILVNNWLGLLPIIGTIGFNQVHEGHQVFVPLFRGGTADLNTTLALALFAVISTHIFGGIFVGLWGHFNKFINIQTILDIPRNFSKDKTVAFLNPINAFVGLIEVIGEVAKVASLSFRLFGNIFAGEVLIAAILGIFAFILPLPFMFLEVLVGLIQALVFSILVLVYLSMSTTAHGHDH